MNRHKSKILVLALLSVIIFFNVFPSNEASAALPGEAKNDALDPDLDMITGEQYKNNEGSTYTIKEGTEPSMARNDYKNDMNWYVDTQGFTHKKPKSRTREGMMPLLRPLKAGDLGRMVTMPEQIDSWASKFNGNGKFMKYMVPPTVITNNKTQKSISRLYIRDLAESAGATIKIEGTGKLDTGLGNELAAAVVTTTSYPDADVTFPAKIEAGKAIQFKISGKEYYPNTEYGKSAYIVWNFTVDGKKVDSGRKMEKNFSKDITYNFQKDGLYTVELTVMDQAEREFKVTKKVQVGTGTKPPPPADVENIPPVAGVVADPFIYWPETMNFGITSYDPDGDIVFEEIRVDGVPSGKSWQSPQVSEKTSHTVYFTNTDDAGATAEATDTFEVLPTIPEAKAVITGTLKANRAVQIDAKASDKVSPVQVAPIDYNKSSWKLTPKSEGVTQEDVKIRKNADNSIKEVLFKKPGTYQLELTVTNIYNETSAVYKEDIEIRPDEKPVAAFTVDKSTYLRNSVDNNNATITLTDDSASLDGDTIQQRIWYVEFDADNDGVFGTLADGGKQILSNGNLETVTYKTDHVGHYRFSLEVKEDFGEPTYQEFISDKDYLRDESEMLDEGGSVAVYMDPANHNQPLKDKAIEVDNVPPIIDFAVKRKNSMHVVLDFGGMDIATRHHQTGAAPGGGQYDHVYYTIDKAAKNALTNYAGNLETDLRTKGLDATVSINNCYFEEHDLDGTCIRNIPVYGWVDYGYYSYSSYSGQTPYSGSWEVTSSSSSPIYTKVPVWCYQQTWYPRPNDPKYPDGGFFVDQSHAPPCSNPNNTQYETRQTGTLYTASLRRYNPDMRYQIVSYRDEGCRYTHQIDTTDFAEGFNSFAFNNNADYKFYYRMDRQPWSFTNNIFKMNSMANKIRNSEVFLWNNSAESLRPFARNLTVQSGREGRFTQYDLNSLHSNVQRLRDDLLNQFMIEEDPESFTIVLGDEVDYTTVYEDFEEDPELKREWKFVHDPTSVNERVIDAQPAAPFPQSDMYINAPVQLPEVGTYTVTLRAKDNPLSKVGNDGRFADYQKWSDEEVVREYKINVHRRPIADFTYKVSPSLQLTLDPNTSFDPDHEKNWSELGIAERGIVEYTWEKYVVDGVEHSGAPPEILTPFKDYFVTLRVKDIDGAYGTVTKLISAKNINLKPVALFDSPALVLRSDVFTDSAKNAYIRDRSYDPNGDPLTDYNWTVKRQSDGVVVWQGAEVPESFEAMKLPAGKYLIGLTVWDIPKYPPALQSDLYEREITVVENNPPNSCFELHSQDSVSGVGTIDCVSGKKRSEFLTLSSPTIYTDKSSDPDGHKLINYSWTVEKLNAAPGETKIWNTGSPPIDFNQFGGIGEYKITQTVFDSPPSPLPSLSGSYVRYFTVVQGPQAPFAMFTYADLAPKEHSTIRLRDASWDVDGKVVEWEYRIEAPDGKVTMQRVQNPNIFSAKVGTYKVWLNVWDDNWWPGKLKSKIPAYKEIVVTPHELIPPEAVFTWEPYEPFLGEEITLDPSASSDKDGEITDYEWSIKSKEGRITTSTDMKPSFTGNSEYYDVTLTVIDNSALEDTVTERIYVNIAKLTPLVTHTPDWKEYWVKQGQDADTNQFLAGEKFVINIITSPARRVEGSVYLGPEVGTVQIPSSAFTLVSKGQYEYVWTATIWQENFEKIDPGNYSFDFTGYHPDVTNPSVTSKGNYLIKIGETIQEAMNFHRNF